MREGETRVVTVTLLEMELKVKKSYSLKYVRRKESTLMIRQEGIREDIHAGATSCGEVSFVTTPRPRRNTREGTSNTR